MENCYNMGNVTGGWPAGGIAASNENSLSNCYNVGNVKGDTTGSILGGSSDNSGYSINYRGGNNYTLAGLASSSVTGYSGGHSGKSINQLNTDEFLQTLNSANPSRAWLRDDELYNGYPYIMPKSVVSISVTTPSNKSVYVEGERFDPTGMVVTALYNDGSKGSLISREYSFYPNRELSTANNTVRICRKIID